MAGAGDKKGIWGSFKQRWAKFKKKAVSLVRKYVPSLVLMYSGLNANAAPNTNSSSPDAKPIGKELVRKNKNAKEVSSVVKFRDMNIDLNIARPELLSMIFMSNNKFDAMYAPKGRNADIKNATGIGPLLTRRDVLTDFINSNGQKYGDLQKVIAISGINSEAFLKAWKGYDNSEKRDEIVKDLLKFTWDKSYQPTFDKLAKAGYPEINFENYTNAKYFGYTAAVISSLGQSMRQTAEIFKEAKQQADAKLGSKATIDDYIDMSYDIRSQRWGLRERYYGKNGSVGEKELNKRLREAVRNVKQFDRMENTAFFEEHLNKEHVIKRDATELVEGGQGYWRNKQEIDSLAEVNNVKELVIPELKSKSVSELFEQRSVLEKEIADLRTQLSDMSYGDYKIMGRNLHIDYASFNPAHVPHVFESALDPTMADSKNSALGLYQFNLNSTMNLLAKDLSDEFPEISAAIRKHGTKSAALKKVWKELSLGEKKERFEYRQFKFMWDTFYKKSFDKLTRYLNMPKITMENCTDPQYSAYVSAVMSIDIQGPKHTYEFMKRAHAKVAKANKTYSPDPNEVGLASYDVRDAVWGRRSAPLHRRYMGGRGIRGEKELVANMLRYNREAPRLMNLIDDKVKELRSYDMALAGVEKKNLFGDLALDVSDKGSVPDKVRENKREAIMVHVRNMKELRTVRKRLAGKKVQIATVNSDNGRAKRAYNRKGARQS